MAPPQNRQQILKRRRRIWSVLLIALLIVGPLSWLTYITWHTDFVSPKPLPQVSSACDEMHAHLHLGGNGISQAFIDKQEYIGVSDGSFIFDSLRPDGDLKCQGALQYRLGAYDDAGVLWTKSVLPQNILGLHYESNDAEALIYRENSRVINSRQDFVTFIIGTVLTGNYRNIGYDVLQGAYIAQQEFNRSKTASELHIQVCLWVANFGSIALSHLSSDSTLIGTEVAQQMLEAAKSNTHVKGIVVGLPYTSNEIITMLNNNNLNLPIILTGAYSENQIHGLSNIFPIAASTELEGKVAADFALKNLKSENTAILVDEGNPYDASLANAFQQEFTNINSIANNYQTYCYQEQPQIQGQCQGTSIQAALAKAMNSSNPPDLIYLAGDAVDADSVLGELKGKNIFLMGGDAFYEVSGNNYKQKHYRHLFFTAFAYPDHWTVPNGDLSEWAWRTKSADMGKNQDEHLFPDLYRLTFSGGRLNAYGFSRPDNDAILSFDGAAVLIHGITILLHNQAKTQSSSSQTLSQMLVYQIFEGFMGSISFADPTKRNVVLLCVGGDGFTKEVQEINTCV